MTLSNTEFLIGFALIVLLSAYALTRLVHCPTNQLEWQDLVATNGILNAYKIGYWIGVSVGSWVVVKCTYDGNLDATVFTAYLACLGGVPVASGAIGAMGSRGTRPHVAPKKLPPVPPPEER